MPTCSACGAEGQDAAFCTECGRPMSKDHEQEPAATAADSDQTRQPEPEPEPAATAAGSDQTKQPEPEPAATAADSDETKQPEPERADAPAAARDATAPSSTPGTRAASRRKALIAGGITTALVLIAGLAFGVPALTNATRTGALTHTSGGAGGGATGLQVSNAPDLTDSGGSFRNGYAVTWRFDESDSDAHDYTLLADAGDVLIVNAGYFNSLETVVYERTGIIGLSKQTGKKLWTGPSTADAAVQCAPKPFGQWIVCSIGHYPGTDGLVMIDPKTGQEGTITGLPEPPMWVEAFVVADDALYVQTRDMESGQLVTTKFTDPKTIAWRAEGGTSADVQACRPAFGTGHAEGGLVAVSCLVATVLHAGTGALVASAPDSRQVALLPGPAIVTGGASATKIERKSADGASYCSVETTRPLAQATTMMAPIVETEPGAVIGVDPKSCTQSWQATLPFTPFRSAWNGGDIAVVSSASGDIAGVKVADGTVVWRSTLPNHTASFDEGVTEFEPDGVEAMVLLPDGTLLVQYLANLHLDGPPEENTMALDSTTGGQVWHVASAVFGGSFYSGLVAEPSLQDGFLIAGGREAIERWDPADEWSLDGAAASLPADAPSCPSGMSPLTFSRYRDGAVLVCGAAKGGFAVVARDATGAELTATSLSFSGRSCEVRLADGRTIRLSLGGAWVQAVSGSSSAQYAATEAWDYRSGVTTLAAGSSATDVRQCPAGSWPISLSTWNGGWLLVCGTSADQPTLLAYSDKEAGQGEAATVSVDQNGYCGKAAAGEACAFAAPATVRLPGANGVQRTAAASSFDTQGPGAKDQAGAYGVKAPDDTAKDQVRYLVDILNSSAQTRANLQPVLDRVNHKQVGSAEIAALTTVSDSRRDLRAAVLAAPVDKVPDGEQLVAELAHALQVSEDCDRLYVEWATIVQAGDDDADIVSRWRPKASESERAKEVFLDRWNATIVPEFTVQAFTADEI